MIVHGFGDHIGRYGHLVSRLAGAGLACALFDLRGHGRSEGRRGHVDRFVDWVNDLASFIHFSETRVPEGTPLFIIGVGVGALIAINYILTHLTPVEGIVAISAALRPRVQIPKWKRWMVKKAVGLVPTMSIDNGIALADLTRDEAELSSLSSDSLFHRRITIGTALEIEKNLELIVAMPCRIHLPMFMLVGGDDRICDPHGTRQFALHLSSSEKVCQIYPNMYHDLLHDMGREKVLEDVEKWIFSRVQEPLSSNRQVLLTRRKTLWENVSSL